MFNENDNASVSPGFSHDDKENCSPSASDTDKDAVIENDDDASASEVLSGTSLVSLGALSKRKKKTSWIWDYFKTIASNQTLAFCTLCSQNVNYGKSRSTGMLERHVQGRHLNVHSFETGKAVKKKMEAQGDSGSTMTQSSQAGFVVHCPSFEERALRWMIKTYQPLCAVENEEFRDMCRSISKRCPIISVDKISRLLKIESMLFKPS